ncbi:ribonuclease III [Candidatus Nomurabacteria bacterium RIFCSPLOWO2_01_FULL_36_10b]|uniref:Ribonuclease 3 n=1 Tax=Candidatus Nomurabacteria bacterium RIFCSPLOWO2_01_FULL_36_10b TaxID=1801766 RepID=A0A1F6WQG6_9BACT|nr:MAG: ribonuclease III [Candidatus Nomurabacteria bacterium RIFCSPLOWO2_01_FULL_36_10b]
MKNFSDLKQTLGITFDNQDLLKQAFTHRSYINENPDSGLSHNERLEYLGDAVLELSITQYLFHTYPNTPEGELTAYRAALVRTESISDVARKLNFDDYLLLSKGEAKDTGKARDYILANTFEAFVGALYLDQGYNEAEKFIGKYLWPNIIQIVEEGTWKDPKSLVQEKAQDIFSVTPSYIVLNQVGPDHDKLFTVGIAFGDDLVAEGTGHSKQDAEQKAARAALIKMGWKK